MSPQQGLRSPRPPRRAAALLARGGRLPSDRRLARPSRSANSGARAVACGRKAHRERARRPPRARPPPRSSVLRRCTRVLRARGAAGHARRSLRARSAQHSNDTHRNAPVHPQRPSTPSARSIGGGRGAQRLSRGLMVLTSFHRPPTAEGNSPRWSAEYNLPRRVRITDYHIYTCSLGLSTSWISSCEVGYTNYSCPRKSSWWPLARPVGCTCAC